VHPHDLGEYGVGLGLAVGEDHRLVVGADARPVGRYDDHAEVVEGLQLVRCRAGGGGHACQAGVGAQEVLHGHGAEDRALGLCRHPLLGLHRSLQPVGPMPPFGNTSGVLVDQLDPVATHDVVDIATQQDLGVEGVAQADQELEAVGRVEVVAAELVLDALGAGLGQVDVAGVLVGVVVGVGPQVEGDVGKLREART